MKSKLALVALVSGFAHASLAQTNLAFPGAEGFGRFTTGGTGGKTVHVTTLEDSGPGSFREAVNQPHRTVVFDVGGVIRLQSNVAVSSDLSLLGDTAPAPGITFYGKTVSFSDKSNIVVRYLRFRQGINGDRGKCSVNISKGRQMIFDHCSIQWGRWDCIGVTQGSRDITFQNCLIGQGVAPQRFGCIADSVTNVTLAHNLWINNQSRNPKAKGGIQYVNNVVYNWGVTGLVGGHSGADHYQDVIGNYFIAGPNSNSRALGQFSATDHVYQQNNLMDTDKDGKLNGRAVAPEDFGKDNGAPTFASAPGNGPLDGLKIMSATAALTNVLTNAGCSIHRDAVDARLIDEVKSFGKSGKLIQNEAEIGGL